MAHACTPGRRCHAGCAASRACLGALEGGFPAICTEAYSMQGLIIQPEGTRNAVWLMPRGNIHKHSQTCIEKTGRDVLLAVYVSCVHLCASRSWLRAHSTAAGPEMTTATIVLLASTACTAGVFLSGLPAEEDRLCRRSKEA